MSWKISNGSFGAAREFPFVWALPLDADVSEKLFALDPRPRLLVLAPMFCAFTLTFLIGLDGLGFDFEDGDCGGRFGTLVFCCWFA